MFKTTETVPQLINHQPLNYQPEIIITQSSQAPIRKPGYKLQIIWAIANAVLFFPFLFIWPFALFYAYKSRVCYYNGSLQMSIKCKPLAKKLNILCSFLGKLLFIKYLLLFLNLKILLGCCTILVLALYFGITGKFKAINNITIYG